MDGEEVLLGFNLFGVDFDLDKGGVMDFLEGEIK